MFSLSTSWNWAQHKNGCDLLEEIRGLGFQSLELGFSLSETKAAALIALGAAAGA